MPMALIKKIKGQSQKLGNDGEPTPLGIEHEDYIN